MTHVPAATVLTRVGSQTMRPMLRMWLWLVVASSFVVYFEPAACDMLIIGLFAVAFGSGLGVPRKLGVPLVLLVIFLAGNLLASSLGPAPAQSVTPLVIRTYLVLCWWLLIASLISEHPGPALRVVWNAYAFAAVIAAVIGALAFFGVIPDFGQLLEYGRVRSLFKDANVYGPFLIPPTLFMLHRLEVSSGFQATVSYLLFGLLGFGLLLGFSRGSWLNFAAALLVYLVLRLRSQRAARQRRRLLLAMAGIAAAAAALLSVAAVNGKLSDMLEQRARVIQHYDVGSDRTQGVGRFDAQLEFLELAVTRPLGIGAGQSESSAFLGMAPHNLYLHVLVEAGWIGGLAFMAFIFFTLFYATRHTAESAPTAGLQQVAVACLVGVLVQSLFVDSTHWRHFYLLLAMIWGAASRQRPAGRA